MLKLDLHTHSAASKDGGISPAQYAKILNKKVLDFVAVTDHNTIEVAQKLNKQFGQRIIVGEEIMTKQGEIIGLFLTSLIKPGQSAQATVEKIKGQGGLVYIPHPFETIRKGLSEATLNSIAEHIDIIEVHNARAVLQNKGSQAVMWGTLNNKVKVAASDAHGYKALGHTFTLINEPPTALNLVNLLTKSQLVTKRPPLHTLLYPKLNRLKKKVKK